MAGNSLEHYFATPEMQADFLDLWTKHETQAHIGSTDEEPREAPHEVSLLYDRFLAMPKLGHIDETELEALRLHLDIDDPTQFAFFGPDRISTATGSMLSFGFHVGLRHRQSPSTRFADLRFVLGTPSRLSPAELKDLGVKPQKKRVQQPIVYDETGEKSRIVDLRGFAPYEVVTVPRIALDAAMDAL